MANFKPTRIVLVAVTALIAIGIGATLLRGRGRAVTTSAEAPGSAETDLTQPPTDDLPANPLDPALKIARERLAYIRSDVNDYECTMTSRELIGAAINEQVMFARIRNRKTEPGRDKPLSVYLRFSKPASMQGQEVLWVEGQNNNKLLGHQGGALGRFTPAIWLDPHGPIATRGSRYAITEIGIEKLVEKLIEKGERDRKYNDVEVHFDESAEVDGRPGTLIEVKHPTKQSYFDFYIAQINIDRELNLPVRYAAYTWPAKQGEEAVLLEEYIYTDLKINVGLTDADFDEHNKEYGFH